MINYTLKISFIKYEPPLLMKIIKHVTDQQAHFH